MEREGHVVVTWLAGFACLLRLESSSFLPESFEDLDYLHLSFMAARERAWQEILFSHICLCDSVAIDENQRLAIIWHCRPGIVNIYRCPHTCHNPVFFPSLPYHLLTTWQSGRATWLTLSGELWLCFMPPSSFAPWMWNPRSPDVRVSTVTLGSLGMRGAKPLSQPESAWKVSNNGCLSSVKKLKFQLSFPGSTAFTNLL